MSMLGRRTSRAVALLVIAVVVVIVVLFRYTEFDSFGDTIRCVSSSNVRTGLNSDAAVPTTAGQAFLVAVGYIVSIDADGVAHFR